MQLDPSKPFSTQIENLKGDNFEKVVASSLYYAGYHIDRNITFTLNKETVAEIDVVASLITPLNEIRIAVECKGANPNFNDLRKFSTIKQFLSGKEYFIDLIVFGANSTRLAHLDVASLLDIKLLKKEDLSKFILPILWGTGELVQERIKWLNRYLCMFTIESYYVNDVIDSIQDLPMKKQFTGYKKFLYSDVWSIKDPIEQLKETFEKSQNEFKGFSDAIACKLNTSAYIEITNPSNQIVQAAMFLELKHRLLNLNAIARCSILARTKQGRETISQRTPAIRDALNKLCDYNISPTKFMNFVTTFIFIWGAAFQKIDKSIEFELNKLAQESGISDSSAKTYLKILHLVYQSGDGLFLNIEQRFCMKYIPSAIRALGLIHRRSVFTDYRYELFREDKSNLIILDEVLHKIGGINGLRF